MMALLHPYAGYLHMLPQAIANFMYANCLWFNNIEKLPHFLWISSIVVQAGIVYYFTSERFSWLLSSKRYRFGCCCLIVLLHICEFQDLYGTITNLQWWLSYYFFLIALQMFYSQNFPQKREIIFLFLFAFSTVGIIPLYICFVIIAGYRYKKEILTKTDICKILVVTIPTVVQAYLVFASGRTNTELVLIEKFRDTIPAYFVLLGKTFIPQSVTFYTGRFIIVGIIIMGFILYQLKDKLNITVFSFIYGLFIYIFNTFPISGNENNKAILSGNFRLVSGNVGARYWFPTLSIFAFLMALALFFALQKGLCQSISALAVFIIVIITVISRFEMENYLNWGDYTRYYSEYSSLFFKDGTKKLRIPLHEPNWAVTVPCLDIDNQNKNELGSVFKIVSIDGNEYIDGMSLSTSSNFVNIRGYFEDIPDGMAYIVFKINDVYYPMYAEAGGSVYEIAKNDNQPIFYTWLPLSTIYDNKLELIVLDRNKRQCMTTYIIVDCK